MQYNLVENSQIEANTIEGTVDLTWTELMSLVGSTANITVSGTDTLVIDCDLGHRIHVSDVQYYFTPPPVSGTAVSGISFYYKNEDFETYVSLDALSGAGYYYASISGSSFAPRFIRIKHDVTASGSVNAFKVLNNDTVVDYGIDGNETSIRTDLDLIYTTETIREVEIYNSGTRVSRAFVIVEPQNTEVDKVFTISLSEAGPWYGPQDEDKTIFDQDLSEYGSFNDTERDLYGSVKIADAVVAYLDTDTVGQYTTNIHEITQNSKLNYFNLSKDYDRATNFISVDEDDTEETIEIRYSNKKPLPYTFYRRVHWFIPAGAGDERVCYRDELLDGTEIARSDKLLDEVIEQEAGGHLQGKTAIDYTTGRGVAHFNREHPSSAYGQDCILAVTDFDHSLIDNIALADHQNNSRPNVYTYLLQWGYSGFWMYSYINELSNPQESDYYNENDKFYLGYFSVTTGMSNTYRNKSEAQIMYDGSVEYNLGNLWYTDSSNNTAVKLEKETGDLLYVYSVTDEVRGVAAKPNGGCYFIQGAAVLELDSDATLLNTIDLTDYEEETISRIAIADDGGLWLTDGARIVYLNSAGRYVYNVQIEHQPVELQPIIDGVVMYCTDGNYRVFNGNSRLVTQTIQPYYYQPNNDTGHNITSYYTFLSADHDEPLYGNQFPISADTEWYNKEWQKINLNHYNLPDYKYVQARITLRNRSTMSYSPIYSNDLNTNDGYGWYIDSGNVFFKNDRMETDNGSATTSGTFDISNNWELSWKFNTPSTLEDETINFYIAFVDTSNFIRVYVDRYLLSNYFGVQVMYGGSLRQNLTVQKYNYYGYGADIDNYYECTMRKINNDFYLRHWRSDVLDDNIPDTWDITFTEASFEKSGPFRVSCNTVSGTFDDLNFQQLNGDYYEYVSPRVHGLYIQTALELDNVYPDNYKTIYLRASSEDITDSEAGEYDTNLKTWWFIPE